MAQKNFGVSLYSFSFGLPLRCLRKLMCPCRFLSLRTPVVLRFICQYFCPSSSSLCLFSVFFMSFRSRKYGLVPLLLSINNFSLHVVSPWCPEDSHVTQFELSYMNVYKTQLIGNVNCSTRSRGGRRIKSREPPNSVFERCFAVCEREWDVADFCLL